MFSCTSFCFVLPYYIPQYNKRYKNMKQKDLLETIEFCERKSKGELEKRHLTNLLKYFECEENNHIGSHIITIVDKRLKIFFEKDKKYATFKRFKNGREVL